jgi:predicted lipoprotein with Yx(FWY)xxD motif
VNKLPILGCALAGLVLLAGCGSSKSTTSSSSAPAAAAATTSATTPTTAAAPGEAILTKHSKLGTILAAGPKKMTVYEFEGDRPGQTACMGACAQAWPPVTSAGAAQAGGAAVAADLGTLTRPDGTKQVTYKGHPLYFFVKDKDDGDAYGQGVKAFGADWYVLKPNGSKLDTGDTQGSSGNAS